MIRYVLPYLLLCTFCKSYSQDLTGTWEGYSSNAAPYVKMVIVKQGSNYIGYTYDEGMGYCEANFLGDFNQSTQILTGKGVSFIRRSWTHSLAKYRLTYSRKGNEHFLDGVLLPKTTLSTLLSFGVSESVSLKRTSIDVDTTDFMRQRLLKIDMVNEKAFPDTTADKTSLVIFDETPPVTPIPSRVDTLVRDNILAAKERRSIDTISTIVTSEKTITISIFDNGQVDGDTITVFHNNQLLLSRHFVSATPYKITLTINKQEPRHELLLVANNLGSIPPNTAVLLVDAADKRYRLTASSDLKKNALLIFEYRE